MKAEETAYDENFGFKLRYTVLCSSNRCLDIFEIETEILTFTYMLMELQVLDF